MAVPATFKLGQANRVSQSLATGLEAFQPGSADNRFSQSFFRQILKRYQRENMISDFKAFISRGNVIDLAIAVVIGAAFSKIINTIADGLISPLISLIAGGRLDFKDKFINWSGVEALPDGRLVSTLSAKDIAEQGLVVFRYGELLTNILNFLIVAFIVFLIARWIGKYFKVLEAAAPPTPSEVLLAEIRDSLRADQIQPKL